MAAHDSPDPRYSTSGPLPTLAHDGNLGLPVDDLVWREFLDRHGIRPAGYDDMGRLTVDLKRCVAAVAYLPAANYFYLRDDPSYEPVASSLYAANQSPRLSSVLVVAKSSGITALDQLRGGRLGIAHRYCTTSYFAPALVVRENGDAIADFFAALIQVPPYQGQIDSVLAGGGGRDHGAGGCLAQDPHKRRHDPGHRPEGQLAYAAGDRWCENRWRVQAGSGAPAVLPSPC